MDRGGLTRWLMAALCGCALASTVEAQVTRYGLPTRVELHMLPAVSSTPLDPDWHPTQPRIAYSMRGDIWVHDLETGIATAVTQGPGYHFEPAWSPDGQRIAMAVDFDGQMDLAIVNADGTGFARATDGGSIDVQPDWTPDGATLVFASASGWDFDIMSVNLETGLVTTVVGGGGNQFQPGVSPDGTELVYISRVRGRLGSGGIWRRSLAGGEPTLVHYEETSYRPAPVWTPDGASLVFASDASGSYDLATVPATGGNRVRLTSQPLDEFAPAVSPDGSLVAFVGNQHGHSTLYITSRWGEGNTNWTEVAPVSVEPQYQTGTIRGRVLGPDDTVLPARIQMVASDGRAYVPDQAFHRVSSVNEIHYFHSTGEFEVTAPAGTARIEAVRGFEWIPDITSVVVPPGGSVDVDLRLTRLADPASEGWISGDIHVHDLHEGRYGLTQEQFFQQFEADDLRVANSLIHMDGTKIMGRWADLTGADHGSSTSTHLLRYAQEFRGSFGHVALLGVSEFMMPLIGGTAGSPYPEDGLKLAYLDSVRAVGGIGGFVHPYTRNNGSIDSPDGAAQSDIPIHVLLGRGDFFDVVSYASDEMASAQMYYHLLNVGARLPATGGTDNFSNVWRDPSGGTARTYARIDGDFGWHTWIEAVRAGRTVATNGPLLSVEIDGQEPGSAITPRREVTVKVALDTIVPVDVIEVIVDGAVAYAFDVPPGPRHVTFEHRLRTAHARWVAVRARGGVARYSGDAYAFAQTTPVYFEGAPPNEAALASAAFLTATIEEIWRRVERRDRWLSLDAKATYRNRVEEALSVLEGLRR